MAASIIAIGNPGAGKSTILNSLAGELLFNSGVSIGEGLTYQLDEGKNKRGTFYDTPGLADDTHREAAGKAISTALRKGGPFKILFFVRLEEGRIIREDITTFKLVLESAPEIGNKYGIVINKLPDNVAKQLENPDKALKLLTKLFASIPEERRCAPSNLTHLPYRPEAASEDNYLVDLETLKTLDGTQFNDFVYRQLQTVQLTPDAAKDIETDDFDKMTKVIEALEKKMEADKHMFQEQQELLLKQLEKAEKGKQEQSRKDRDMFNEQMELMKEQMKQKEREIQQARDDAIRREKLQQEQMENQLEYQRQQFQQQMAELAETRRAEKAAEVQSRKEQMEQMKHLMESKDQQMKQLMESKDQQMNQQMRQIKHITEHKDRDIKRARVEKETDDNVAGDIFDGAAKGAALGAAVGSVVPGLGNVIGGGVGAIGGAILSLFK